MENEFSTFCWTIFTADLRWHLLHQLGQNWRSLLDDTGWSATLYSKSSLHNWELLKASKFGKSDVTVLFTDHLLEMKWPGVNSPHYSMSCSVLLCCVLCQCQALLPALHPLIIHMLVLIFKALMRARSQTHSRSMCPSVTPDWILHSDWANFTFCRWGQRSHPGSSVLS